MGLGGGIEARGAGEIRVVDVLVEVSWRDGRAGDDGDAR
jgi:hypothetical protein